MGLPLQAIAERRSVVAAVEGKTVSEAYQVYLTKLAVVANEHSLQTTRSALRVFLGLFGDRLLSTLTEEDGDALLLEVSGSGVSKSWLVTLRARTRAFLKSVRAPDILAGWPKMPVREKDLRHIRDHLTDEEIAGVLEHLPKKLKGWFMAAVLLGFRRQNLCDLRWAWISQDQRFITIPASYFKQGRSLENFPLSPRLLPFLGPRGKPGDPVFPDLPDVSNINRWLRKAAKAAGIDPRRVRPHNCRRTWCRLFAESGGTWEQAQLLQGWRSDSEVREAYWPRMKKEVAFDLISKM